MNQAIIGQYYRYSGTRSKSRSRYEYYSISGASSFSSENSRSGSCPWSGFKCHVWSWSKSKSEPKTASG